MDAERQRRRAKGLRTLRTWTQTATVAELTEALTDPDLTKVKRRMLDEALKAA